MSGSILMTAIYLRYSSREDSRAESSSIENQRTMLHHFIKEREDLKFYSEYADDDYTGTNFAEVR